MKTMLKAEFNKLRRSRAFWITLAVGTAITVASAVEVAIQFGKDLKMIEASQRNYMNDPGWQISTVFNHWIGGDYTAGATTLFYMLLPLLAALPFAAAYCSEQKSGYIKNILIRAKRHDYYLSKFIAVFISGALAAALPMLINLLAVTAIFPTVKPDVVFVQYYVMPNYVTGSEIFYTHPWLWVIIRFVMAMAFCGAVADFALAISMLIKNRFAAVILPFIGFMTLNYFAGFYGDLELSPMRNLGALSVIPTSMLYIFGLDAVLLITAFLLFVIYGEKKDVF